MPDQQDMSQFTRLKKNKLRAVLGAGTKGPITTGPPRAVPCGTFAAREAAQLEEITRRIEPLMVRAHNGGGVVWQSKLCQLLVLQSAAVEVLQAYQERKQN